MSQTITQKKRKSLLLWVLIFIIIGAVVALGVFAYLGYISLQFLSDGVVGYAEFGASSPVNAVLIIIGPMVLGGLIYYAIKKYFIGEKVTTTMAPYMPGGQTISPAQQADKETVIS